ncbi:beta-lactamase family protein [Lentzea sp. PSKA42]|uniref:Beta-lactamase family protein n=1 Tax=Lentzea indica TaxID=2604800 RepID=A0ABX1FCW5_9PSEU|nr:serine hydrolase domain-containing protein [Lentzea indica]NKE56755.1 beta-lactamase family protein [Lentzea indica]
MFDTDIISRRFKCTAQTRQVPGAQLTIHHRGETLTWEFGVTELGSALTVQRDTAIPIGSVTKAFTATLAMALVSDGDLDLDTPVMEHSSELRRLSPGLTLRHLLSHTGGLTSDFEPDDATSPRRHLQDCCALVPVLPPGTCFSYSNVGYVIVAHLVELVTGMTWAEAAEVLLLRPLGITPAFVGRADTPRQVATGHTVNRATGAIRPVEQSLADAEAATGALAMSALDLVTFGRMHLPGDGGIISADALATMHKPQPGADPFGLAEGWGLGLAVYGGTWLGHDGMGDGTSCHLRIQPDSGTVVALTTNSSSGYQMWKQLIPELRSAGLVVGDHEPLSGSPRPIPPPAACAGRYRNGDTEYSIAIADGDGLRLTIDGELSAQLIPYEGLAFSINDPWTGEFVQAGRFLPDDVQRVHGIQITGRTAARVDF